MDAGARLERLRNRTIATWNATKPDTKREQHNEKSNQLRLCRVLGDLPFFTRGKPEDLTLMPTSPQYSLEDAVFIALHDLFVYEAAQNLGPTKCSRMNYLWFASLTQAYNWVQGGFSGIRDAWNWDVRHLLDSSELFLWMNRFLIFMMPYFVPDYSGSVLLAGEQKAMASENIAEEVTRIQTKGHWSAFQNAWLAWWTYRQSDNADTAAIHPASAELPNGSLSLDVADTVDPDTFPHSESWTPLKIGTKTQNYLTFNWKSVLGTGLSEANEAMVEAAASTLFPSETERASEIAEVVQITGSLTDNQKVQAEFWAGGPYTVSPPGMCIWFWKQYMQSFRIAKTRGYRTLFHSGLDLAIHIFETSRLVWGLKKLHMQARPIQEVRRLYRGQTLTGYDGLPVAAELWMPYQEANFVSPPFADFPSGHSAFSQSFALVMTRWFGPTIPTSSPTVEKDLALLSPVFAAAQTNAFGKFVFPAGTSQIQNGVPVAPVELTWSTWQDMADSAGLSRLYGGIHAMSAHTGSQALANALHTALQEVWSFQ